MDPDEVRFNFKIIRKIHTAFLRQISEAVVIRMKTIKGEDTLLNNKLEFSRCVLPELEIMMKDKIVLKKLAKETKEDIQKTELEPDPEEIKLIRKRDWDTDGHRPADKRRRTNNNKKISSHNKRNVITSYSGSTDIRLRSATEDPNDHDHVKSKDSDTKDLQQTLTTTRIRL